MSSYQFYPLMNSSIALVFKMEEHSINLTASLAIAECSLSVWKVN
ncbi:hypothetical protein [Plectonema radiosum]|nr:hypothetical protein [Plectonema radiosum]